MELFVLIYVLIGLIYATMALISFRETIREERFRGRTLVLTVICWYVLCVLAWYVFMYMDISNFFKNPDKK